MPLYNPPSIPGLTVASGNVVINENSADQDFRIESDNETHMLYVDAGNDRVGIGTNSPDAPLHVETSGSGDAMIVESTDAGATDAPDIIFYRNSASPAANDEIGSIRFRGKDSAAGDRDYNRITSVIRDTTSASADADLIFKSLSNSVEIEMMKISRIDGIVINEIGASYIDTRIESDNESHMFFVDASADKIGIGTSSPGFELDVTGAIRATGNVTCNALTQTSMRSLKKNIGDITKTKAKVIPFKEYEFKSGDTTRKRYGVVVEDIENDYPELVYDLGGGVKAVNYIDLLVKRVAEMEKELTEITGAKGDKGDKGDTGAQGATGAQGPAGADGTNGTNGKDGNSHLNNVNSISFNSKFGKTGALEVTIGKTKYRFVPADE